MPVTIMPKDDQQLMAFYDHLPGKKSKVSDDQLLNISHQIKNLTKEQAFQGATMIADRRGYGAFLLGGVLRVIKDHNWHHDNGYKSFGLFVEGEFGISKSTAYDHMNIYKAIVESGVTWSKLEHIGWTKIRLFAKCLTKTNVDAWIENAASMNASQLREFVKSETQKTLAELSESAYQKQSTHVDNSEDNQAQEITHDSEGSPLDQQEVPTEKLVTKDVAKGTTIKVFYHLYPNQKQIVEMAIEVAMDKYETQSKGKALEYLCQQFLANQTGKPLETP